MFNDWCLEGEKRVEQKKQRQKFDIKQKIVKMNYFEMFEMKQIPFSDYMTIYIILLKVRNLIHIPNWCFLALFEFRLDFQLKIRRKED